MYCRHNFHRFCQAVPIEEYIHGMEDRIWGQTLRFVLQHLSSRSKFTFAYLPPAVHHTLGYVFNPLSNVTIPTNPLSSVKILIQCREIPCPPGVFHFELYHRLYIIYDYIALVDAITVLLWLPNRPSATTPQNWRHLCGLRRLFYNSMYHYYIH